MAIKLRNMGGGFTAANQNGIRLSSVTNTAGQAVELTLNADHRTAPAERLAIGGITAGFVSLNGVWTAMRNTTVAAPTVASTTVLQPNKKGGADSASTTLTAALELVVANAFDKTPFLPGHRGCFVAAAPAAATLTIQLQGTEVDPTPGNASTWANNFSASKADSAGTALTLANDPDSLLISSGGNAIPAFTAFTGSLMFEVDMQKYMRMRCTVWTSGSVNGFMMA